MGQRIRSLCDINIGNNSMEVELNEGDSIHIQNKNYRVEMKTHEFIRYAACILYANEQFESIKKSTTNVIDILKDNKVNQHKQYVDSKEILSIINQMNEYKVEYLLVTNNGNELPFRLEEGKDLDILVKPESKADLKRCMKKNGFSKIKHPLSSECGYNYNYKCKEPEFYSSTDGMFKVDVHYDLTCKSLTPYNIVPLNSEICNLAWNTRVKNLELSCWETSDIFKIVYLIIRAVFDKDKISQVYCDEIYKRIDLLENELVIQCLYTEFYSFTPQLIKILKDRKIECLKQSYLSFIEY